MRRWMGYWIVFFLLGVGNEVVLCVSTLMLAARALSLSDIAFVMMLGFAGTTILEVPSGVMSDLWGRKRLWILSVLCSLMWLATCFIGTVPLIAMGAVINGIGVALRSGTLDALYVEEWIACSGKERIARAGMWSTLFTYLGFAVGALVSGALPRVWKETTPYTLHLLVSASIFSIMLLVACKAVREVPRKQTEKSGSFFGSVTQIYTQLRQAIHLTRQTPLLFLIASAAVVMGFSTVGVELYWQPRLQALSQPEQLAWMLSICSFFSMGMLAVLGIGAAAILERVHSTAGKVAVYAVYRFTMIAVMVCMAFLLKSWVFAAFYVLYYLIMGGQDTVEGVLLHQVVPNEQRGTVMSIQSLALRFGGMISQALCGVLLLKIELMQVWLFLAVMHAVGYLLCLLLFLKRKKLDIRENVKKMGEKAENLTCP